MPFVSHMQPNLYLQLNLLRSLMSLSERCHSGDSWGGEEVLWVEWFAYFCFAVTAWELREEKWPSALTSFLPVPDRFSRFLVSRG